MNALRALGGLGAASWADATLTAGTSTVKAVHFLELRSALNELYSSYGLTVPSYTDSNLGVGTTIKRVHVTELRAAALGLGLPNTSAPTFSPTPGAFFSAQTVYLSTSTGGATIRYTTDGSQPRRLYIAAG